MNFKVVGVDEGQKAKLIKERYEATRNRARLKIRCPKQLLQQLPTENYFSKRYF